VFHVEKCISNAAEVSSCNFFFFRREHDGFFFLIPANQKKKTFGTKGTPTHFFSFLHLFFTLALHIVSLSLCPPSVSFLSLSGQAKSLSGLVKSGLFIHTIA
jgi:hypothetical protein